MYGIWQGDKLVGGALFPVFDSKNGICEIGVWLLPEYQGRGLITRAARYLIDWAIRVRGMSRMMWRNDPRNLRSQAVARRLGLIFEGVSRSSHVVQRHAPRRGGLVGPGRGVAIRSPDVLHQSSKSSGCHARRVGGAGSASRGAMMTSIAVIRWAVLAACVVALACLTMPMRLGISVGVVAGSAVAASGPRACADYRGCAGVRGGDLDRSRYAAVLAGRPALRILTALISA